MPDDQPSRLGGYSTAPPEQDDIDALRRWALDAANRRNHPDAAKQIHRVCNGVSTLRAEVMGLQRKLKAARARMKKLSSGQTPLSDDDGPHCHKCGNVDRERFDCIDDHANEIQWRCEVCGHESQADLRPIEEEP